MARRLPRAQWSALPHPAPAPGLTRDLAVEGGMVRVRSRAEASAPAVCQQAFGQEERRFPDLAPAQSVRTQATTGYEIVNMRMIFELTGPGVEHAQQAELGAQMFPVPGNVLQGAGAFLEQPGQENLGMIANNPAQLFRHGEGDEEVRDGEEFGLLFFRPLGRVGLAALEAGPMTARVVDVFGLATGAGMELPAQGRRATTQDRRHGGALGPRDTVPELGPVGRPMTTENLRQGEHARGGG